MWTGPKLALTALALAGLAAAGCARDDDPDALDPAEVPASSSTVAPTTSSSSTASTSSTPTTVPAATSTTTVTTTGSSTTSSAASSTPTSAAPPASSTTAAPATTATPPASASVAVAYRGGGDGYWAPISVWDGSAWVEQRWDTYGVLLDTPAIASVTLTGRGLAEPVAGVPLGEPGEFCVSIDQGPHIDVPAEISDQSLIAVTADWDVQPRAVTAAGAEVPEYQALGASLVTPGPAVDPGAGRVREVVRADLDGDGVEEVFVVFERQRPDDSGFGVEGDYSVVVARYPEPDGTVVDEVLFELVERPSERPGNVEVDIRAIADLNGDGVMEVVLGWNYWETEVVEVHALVDGRLELVGGGGCSL